MENLRLCGHYVNRAYMQNLLLFMPVAFVLSCMQFFMNLVKVDPRVS